MTLYKEIHNIIERLTALKMNYLEHNALSNISSVRLEGCLTLINIFASVTVIRKDLNTSAPDAHINAHIRIVNKHRNVADKLGWEPRRKYATARFSIGFCALETGSSH